MAASSSSSLAYRISGIARPLDLRYATNRALLGVVALALVFGLLWTWSEGERELTTLALAALNSSALAFMVWATTRELSPDDDPAAFVAVALMLVAWSRVGRQDLSPLLLLLATARLLGRSTGKAAEPLDSLILWLTLAALTGWWSWVAGAVGALALVLDASLASASGATRRHLPLGLGLAALTLARVFVGVDTPSLPAHPAVLGVIAGAFAGVVLLYGTPRSVGDVDTLPLSPLRVRAAMSLALVASVLISCDPGLDPFASAAPWACLMGAVLGFPWLLIRRRRRPA